MPGSAALLSIISRLFSIVSQRPIAPSEGGHSAQKPVCGEWWTRAKHPCLS
ncbi:hypothetical protein PF005_g27006 [Phytophthora fragariae]|uniref:RxLR effector protein n=1 Tax=Phytophthora fragariae TaxID=53985 RepID=A0A6A4BKR6_9STRA|nr:hypothetical protein PF003_g22487 [Phytophthora fragariae]KAE8922071.1 hypothetical protein PF009_g27656 [Phytophthora fragariae]KAE8971715.1 hypothetical protein PF011_g25933 [Phytophthora fragariae]KAE9069764.1 hypothetical protein PF010_g26543 [Phytophthora fragariae]KAE9070397.1 hypothetical protein PF007_g26953 [Phytophthora fragariae]